MVGNLVGSEDKAVPKASSLLQWYLLLKDGDVGQFYYPSTEPGKTILMFSMFLLAFC